MPGGPFAIGHELMFLSPLTVATAYAANRACARIALPSRVGEGHPNARGLVWGNSSLLAPSGESTDTGAGAGESGAADAGEGPGFGAGAGLSSALAFGESADPGDAST
jgi:hypothetical protein